MDDILSEAGFTMTMKNISGFTLIELMTMIALIGILMAVGVPSFKYLTEPAQAASAARELHSALHVARSEAVRWNSIACVCPSANASSATPSISGNGNWETGWIAFVETGSNCAFDGADRLVKIWDGSGYAWDGVDGSGGITIRNNNATITTPNFIRFSSRGRALQVGGGTQRGMFTICDAHDLQVGANGLAMYARGVDLHTTGRARITKNVAALSAASCPN